MSHHDIDNTTSTPRHIVPITNLTPRTRSAHDHRTRTLMKTYTYGTAAFTTILFAFALILLTGCEINDNSNSNPTPTSPDSVTVLTSGRVTSSTPGTIDCEDTSRTIPADQAAAVRWTVRLVASGDSASSAPGGEVTFTGLAAGTYTVEQVVILKDQSEAPPKTYSVVVSG